MQCALCLVVLMNLAPILATTATFFFLQSNCTANSKLSFPIQAGRGNFTKGEILTGTAVHELFREIKR
jgi:hypothetical protein